MTRIKYLEDLADAARIISAFDYDPMTFAACPGKVSRAVRRWQSASDEERAEAGMPINPPADTPNAGS